MDDILHIMATHSAIKEGGLGESVHIKGGEGRRSSDLTISVIGMCVREADIEEGKGRGREVGERRGEEKGRVGSGEERRRRGRKRRKGGERTVWME